VESAGDNASACGEVSLVYGSDDTIVSGQGRCFNACARPADPGWAAVDPYREMAALRSSIRASTALAASECSRADELEAAAAAACARASAAEGALDAGRLGCLDIDVPNLTDASLDEALAKLPALAAALHEERASRRAARDASACVVCLERPRQILFGCDHFAVCATCAPQCADCPLCRAPVASRRRVYT
jgi:hypothetical protein